MIDKQEMRQQRNQSVQDVPDYGKYGLSTAVSPLEYTFTQRGSFLPAWGTRARERELRLLDRNEFGWLWQAAASGFIKRVAATPWKIRGKRGVDKFQDIFRHAEFGQGWTVFISKVIRDFLRQDAGAFIEVIGPGASDRPLTAPPTGVAYLDSLYCYPTGDPEFPVVYFSRLGEYHALHYTRVIRIVDMPDGDQLRFGYGLSPLSRSVAILMQSIYATSYTVQKLDDRPPPGIMVASNINKAEFDVALAGYERDQSNDVRPVFGKTLWMYNVDPSTPAKLEHTTFSQAPDGWSYKEYTELQVNAIAAALGTDVQEIWQLTGGNLGSGQQSQILHAKSQGKTLGYVYAIIERAFNDLIPMSMEWTFEANDPFEATNEANTATAWASFVNLLGTSATDDEKRRLLAANVKAFSDIVMDNDGEYRALTDVDVQSELPTTAEDNTPLNNTLDAPAPQPEERIIEDVGQAERSTSAEKAIQSTRLDFENDFADLLNSARRDSTNRRRFGIILRDLIRKYGREAYLDGKADGGVIERDLDEDEQREYAAELAKQSVYVTNFANTLYKRGIGDALADLKPEQWFNKSVLPFYYFGVESANRNGMYEWVLGDSEHCSTCLTLNGQRHRMSWFVRRKLLPKSSSLECKGYNCKCTLVKTTERARGSEKALHIHHHED